MLALTIPESPRYLIAKHRIPEAKAILTGLLGPANIDAKIERIRQSMEREQEPSWQDLKAPATGKIAADRLDRPALSVFQQFVGINVIFYYSNVLWEAVGFNESQSFVITVIARHHQHPDHADRHRHDRPDRPKAVADHRLDRHDDHPGAPWRSSSAPPACTTVNALCTRERRRRIPI